MTRVEQCRIFPRYYFYSILVFITVVIRGLECFSQYSEGLNRWSFAKHRGQNVLHSDLLCPNPMLSDDKDRNFTLIITASRNTIIPIPNIILTFKSTSLSDVSPLPCGLRKHSRNETILSHQILFMNISYEPVDFKGAKQCKDFIKLNYDEDEGTDLSCENDNTEAADTHSLSNRENSYIHWPNDISERNKYFSIDENLERFLQHEEIFRSQFFFQLYFFVSNGFSQTCKLQQYKLDLERPRCSDSTSSLQDEALEEYEICGDYSCSDLIFPKYMAKPVKIVKSISTDKDNTKVHVAFDPNSSRNISGKTRVRMDARFLVFITVLPLLMLGALVFGMQIFIYTACLRRTTITSEANRGRDSSRSQQILQNSLNLWETLPVREPRSVSFSPVTTNIDVELNPETSVPELPETPKILKSALKRTSAEVFPPPYECERPPSYLEATKE